MYKIVFSFFKQYEYIWSVSLNMLFLTTKIDLIEPTTQQNCFQQASLSA